jgi:hypothetical protein
LAKRKNRTVLEMSLAMLVEAGLPPRLWEEAVSTAVNRLTTKAFSHSPFQMLYRLIPNVAHLRVLGFRASILIPKEKRWKLDERSILCLFVGYDTTSKCYRCFDSARDRILITHNVWFLENSFGTLPSDLKELLKEFAMLDIPDAPTSSTVHSSAPSVSTLPIVDNIDPAWPVHVSSDANFSGGNSVAAAATSNQPSTSGTLPPALSSPSTVCGDPVPDQVTSDLTVTCASGNAVPEPVSLRHASTLVPGDPVPRPVSATTDVPGDAVPEHDFFRAASAPPGNLVPEPTTVSGDAVPVDTASLSTPQVNLPPLLPTPTVGTLCAQKHLACRNLKRRAVVQPKVIFYPQCDSCGIPSKWYKDFNMSCEYGDESAFATALQNPEDNGNGITFVDAMKHPGWTASMTDEINSIIKNHTWDLVNPPPGVKAISCKWIYKVKDGVA